LTKITAIRHFEDFKTLNNAQHDYDTTISSKPYTGKLLRGER
jgi:hypothetical protein